MSRNALTALPPGLFADLASLTQLHLDNNRLSTLPPGVFAGLANLRTLRLGWNALTALPWGLFAGLSSLEFLSLHYNQLTSLPPGVFAGLTKLQTLTLNNNQLTTLPPGLFTDLPDGAGINLAGNPGYPFPGLPGQDDQDGDDGSGDDNGDDGSGDDNGDDGSGGDDGDDGSGDDNGALKDGRHCVSAWQWGGEWKIENTCAEPIKVAKCSALGDPMGNCGRGSGQIDPYYYSHFHMPPGNVRDITGDGYVIIAACLNMQSWARFDADSTGRYTCTGGSPELTPITAGSRDNCLNECRGGGDDNGGDDNGGDDNGGDDNGGDDNGGGGSGNGGDGSGGGAASDEDGCWETPNNCVSVTTEWTNGGDFRTRATNNCGGRIYMRFCHQAPGLGSGSDCGQGGVRNGQTESWQTSSGSNPTGSSHYQWIGSENPASDWVCSGKVEGWHDDPNYP